MTVRVEYFAILAERRGQRTESVTGAPPTVGQLYKLLDLEYQFGIDRSLIRFAVNDRYVGDDQALGDGDRVVFIPPVSGG